MNKNVGIYARVSTSGQTTDNQIRELERIAERMGWTVRERFIDHGISGTKGRDQRPAFDRLLKAAARREVDLILVWSIDRLGRSLQGLVSFLEEVQGAGVDLYIHQQAINTLTPAGKALFQMCGVFAEFERAMIQERVKAGLARAKASGKRLGRPRIPAEKERVIAEALSAGDKGILRIARQFHVGVSAVQRIKAAL